MSFALGNGGSSTNGPGDGSPQSPYGLTIANAPLNWPIPDVYTDGLPHGAI